MRHLNWFAKCTESAERGRRATPISVAAPTEPGVSHLANSLFSRLANHLGRATHRETDAID
jgi:hypothetical protein